MDKDDILTSEEYIWSYEEFKEMEELNLVSHLREGVYLAFLSKKRMLVLKLEQQNPAYKIIRKLLQTKLFEVKNVGTLPSGEPDQRLELKKEWASCLIEDLCIKAVEDIISDFQDKIITKEMERFCNTHVGLIRGHAKIGFKLYKDFTMQIDYYSFQLLCKKAFENSQELQEQLDRITGGADLGYKLYKDYM